MRRKNLPKMIDHENRGILETAARNVPAPTQHDPPESSRDAGNCQELYDNGDMDAFLGMAANGYCRGDVSAKVNAGFIPPMLLAA